jgi:two-component system nitrate/nitrite response regulator NarL
MDAPPPITLILADDHGIVREGVAAFCKARHDVSLLGQCSDGQEALEMILARNPDFAILDFDMPKLTGLQVVKRIRDVGSKTRVIILSISRDQETIRELFRSGADGYVLKDGPSRHIFDAINYVRDGGQYLTPLLRRELVDSQEEPADGLAQLSKREYEVFSLLVDGVRPKDIAMSLEISPKTVDTYRANIMRKLEIDSIAGLVRYAIQRNPQNAATPAASAGASRQNLTRN